MENENELGKDNGKDTDDGFSEKKAALKFDKNTKTQKPVQKGHIFTPPKTNKTVFQAQKSEEK